ncbi:MAG: hypothetical protein JWO38_3013 [Gemmataceae bacterium]|nr:hypothetical protein [Gemmataceae bacterium]
MTADALLARYHTRRWKTVPVHRPDPSTGRCSCGKDPCPNPGKHPDGRVWPGDTVDPAEFAGRNVGVHLGPGSGNLGDVDKDCPEAVSAGRYLLPPTGAAFGRGGQVTHNVYTVTDGAASYAKLLDPVLAGSAATIVEFRWPERDPETGAEKALMTVFPPSLHYTGAQLEWVRDGDPAPVRGADLAAAVRQVGAAVLLARYARPKERHALVLLIANLLVRAGVEDNARVVAFMAAVFAARNDEDKVAKVRDGEGLGAVTDARKRLTHGKPMTGLPALRDMLDPVLSAKDAEHVVARVKDWLNIPDPGGPKVSWGPAGGPGQPPRYTPLPPWRPFPVEHLPGDIRLFTESVAAAMLCDPTYVALHALAACAGMIGTTRVIQLKKLWTEPAMIWAATIGDSGTLKTPPFKQAVAPVVSMQRSYFKAHAEEMKEYRTTLREYERDKRKMKDDDPGDPPEPPRCIRVYARDVTIEALSGILNDNRCRMLVARDELNGWLSSFNQYKAKGGADQANWLELHHRGTLSYDRKTGVPPTIFIEGIGISLCGGIQPGILQKALSPEHFNAGVPARLLFAYPPRLPKKWTEVDIDEEVEAAYRKLIHGLAELLPHTDDDGEPYPVKLRMTPEAKAWWIKWYDKFGARQASVEGDLAAAFSKLEGYAARLGMIHHVCQSVSAGEEALDPVGLQSVRAGIALAEWFCYEAERVYQMLGEKTEETELRMLVETVRRLADRNGGCVTATMVQRTNQKKYRSADLATLALDGLVQLDLGRWEDRQTGGRPTRVFIPNNRCDESDESPPIPTTGTTAAGVTKPRPG